MDNKVVLAKFKEDGKAGETKVCVVCKRIFTYMGYGHFYCPACKKLDEEEFTKVREYIYNHGTASALEVSEFTGVSLHRITQYLKEGRLEIPELSPIFIKCEMCNSDIRSGRLCPSCAGKLSKSMRESMNFDDEQIGQVPIKIEGKMRYFGNKK